MDERFTREPKKGSNYRVVGVDTFDGSDWPAGDFDTLDEAKGYANEHGGPMCMQYVYDVAGDCVYSAGSF